MTSGSETVFADAWALWVLVPIWLALVVGWGVLTYLESHGRTARTATLGYPTTAPLARLPRSWRPRARRVVQALRLVSLALLVIALARPQSVRGIHPDTTRGIDIVLAIDTSGSMRALDLDSDKPIAQRRTRLQVVKDVVKQFVAKRVADQTALVVFGAEAFLQCPLTLDHQLFATLLDGLQNGMAGDATAIGSGIGAAVSRLKKSAAKSKVIVLLTDGINNAGPLAPKLAAEVAKTFGIRIYTVGVGTRGKAPFLVDQPLFGPTVAYDDVSIDEETLREVAGITGGAYFRAEDSRALAQIYDQIDLLEKSDLKSPTLIDYDERSRPWLLMALALVLFELVLLGTRLRGLP